MLIKKKYPPIKNLQTITQIVGLNAIKLLKSIWLIYLNLSMNFAWENQHDFMLLLLSCDYCLTQDAIISLAVWMMAKIARYFFSMRNCWLVFLVINSATICLNILLFPSQYRRRMCKIPIQKKFICAHKMCWKKGR